jgi:hypothetical protein
MRIRALYIGRLFLGLLLGCLLQGQGAWARATFSREGKILRLGNEWVATHFNADSGEWEILTTDGFVLCSSVKCVWGPQTNSTFWPGTFSYGFGRVHQPLDSGTYIEISRGTNQPFYLVLTILDHLPCVFAQLRAPLPPGQVKELPIELEAFAYPNVPWGQKSLGLFGAAPAWTGSSRWLEKLADQPGCVSTGLFCLRDERQGLGAVFTAVTNLAKVNFMVDQSLSNPVQGLKFAVQWRQTLRPAEKHPGEWESDPLVFIAPMAPGKTARLLRLLLGGETPPAGSGPAEALERLPATP